MNADAKLDAALRQQTGVMLDHATRSALRRRSAHRVDHAAELDDAAIAGPLDDATVMGGDGGVDEITAQAAQTRERPCPRPRRRARL